MPLARERVSAVLTAFSGVCQANLSLLRYGEPVPLECAGEDRLGSGQMAIAVDFLLFLPLVVVFAGWGPVGIVAGAAAAALAMAAATGLFLRERRERRTAEAAAGVATERARWEPLAEKAA